MASSDQENCACNIEPNINGQDASRIRRLNDNFRRTFIGGRVVVTSGIHALGPAAVDQIISAVREHEQFDRNNDPYGEHDFGSFAWQQHRFCWKIDCYDKQLEFGSPDPSNPALTTRVLTVMLAAEY